MTFSSRLSGQLHNLILLFCTLIFTRALTLFSWKGSDAYILYVCMMSINSSALFSLVPVLCSTLHIPACSIMHIGYNTFLDPTLLICYTIYTKCTSLYIWMSIHFVNFSSNACKLFIVHTYIYLHTFGSLV